MCVRRPVGVGVGLSLAVTVLGSLGSPRAGRAADRVTLDHEAIYQTIQGWEATAWANQESPAFEAFRDDLFDRTVTEVGIDRLRLEVRSGAENSRDFWGEYQRGEIEYQVWRENRYATVNDNADPDALDRGGFHFSELSDTVEKVVLPIRERVAAAGEELYVNLNYVAFTGQITSGRYEHADPAEYAEFMHAVFLHLDERYGWVPDAIEILLEPDNVTQWNGTLLGRSIVATAAKLSAHGFAPEFIAPSNTNMGNAVSYFDALAAVPGALDHLDELAYHRYGGVSTANLQAIADRAVSNGLRTSMLEWWTDSNTYDVLHQDLELGRNSAWQQAVVIGHFDVDESDPSKPRISLKPTTRYIRQYTRFVRRGAVRIGASSTSGRLRPLAFTTGSGEVVVVNASAGGDFEVAGLSSGSYGIQYTTAAAHAVDLPDVAVGPSGTLTATIPSRGVVTIYVRDGERPGIDFRRGDCNDDGTVDVSDASCILNWLFLGGATPGCIAVTNTNGDASADISDAVYVLARLFLGGPAPFAPFPDCGAGTLPTDEESCATPPKSCQQ